MIFGSFRQLRQITALIKPLLPFLSQLFDVIGPFRPENAFKIFSQPPRQSGAFAPCGNAQDERAAPDNGGHLKIAKRFQILHIDQKPNLPGFQR
ncbi:MAG: hypothetical protein R3360_08565, partial [Alphaproteobacteria bacterium]|nr:hypothetical protein [Alphaproteobacteria bacterium]